MAFLLLGWNTTSGKQNVDKTNLWQDKTTYRLASDDMYNICFNVIMDGIGVDDLPRLSSADVLSVHMF